MLATVNSEKVSNAANALSYNSKSQSNHPYCTHCNRSGHTADRCYQLHGFPPDYKGKYKNGNSNSRLQVNQAAAAIVDGLLQRAISDNSLPKSIMQQSHGSKSTEPALGTLTNSQCE